MRSRDIVIGGLLSILAAAPMSSAGTLSAGRTKSVLPNLPIVFIENQGQYDSKAQFVAQTSMGAIEFAESGVLLGRDNSAMRLEWVGGESSRAIGGDLLPGTANFLHGSDAALWKTGVPNYGRIVYHDVYPGIDLLFYGQRNQLKYDCMVAPGVDPHVIRMRYRGADSLTVTPGGDLVVHTPFGPVVENRPLAYQGADVESGREIACRFELVDRDVYTFALGTFDRTEPLTIDPGLTYSSYLGGQGWDMLYDIAIDDSGYVYVAGQSGSADMPVQDSIQEPTHCGDNPIARICPEIYIAKFDASVSTMIFGTWIGGSEDEVAHAMAIDDAGNVYLTGVTNSLTGTASFPIVNAFDATPAPHEHQPFALKLDHSGSYIVYSTYVAGSDTAAQTRGTGVTVDGDGTAYFVGPTFTPTDFPLYNAWDSTYNGDGDCYLLALDSIGQPVFCTYFGGSDQDAPADVVLDASGNVWVTGNTASSDFPLQSAIQTQLGGSFDAFVSCFSGDGSQLAFSTYFGGSGDDDGACIRIASDGACVFAGNTTSSGLSSGTVYQSSYAGAGDVFVAKIPSSLSSISYCTYLGGSSRELMGRFCLDDSDNLYLCGATLSSDFPSSNPGFTDKDAFVTYLSANGQNVSFSMQYGAGGVDEAFGIARESGGDILMVGWTVSINLPHQNAYQSALGDDPNSDPVGDGFIARFSDDCCVGIRGNVDGSFDGGINFGDLTFLSAYLFSGGWPPPCLEEGDVDGSGTIVNSDLLYLIAYLTSGGPAPVSCP